jgi:hypothetical protein
LSITAFFIDDIKRRAYKNVWARITFLNQKNQMVLGV